MTAPRTLVTGGAGFLASHVVDSLVAMGHDVVVLDDLSGGLVSNVNDHASFVEGSVTDLPLLRDLFSTPRIDYIFHLAAYAAEGLSHHIRRFNYETNLIGSANLINLAINSGVRCFVFTSSAAIYGDAPAPFSESTIPHPIDPYGISKLAVELDLAAAHRYFGLDYIVFRPHNVYGERQSLRDPYRNVVAIFLRQALSGLPLTIFGDGSQTRAFTHVADVAPLIASSVTVPEAMNETFNIGAGEAYTVNELAQHVLAAIPASVGVIHLPPRFEAADVFSNHDRLRRVFGDHHCTPLAKGICRMASWAASQPLPRPRPLTHIEVGRNLPPSWADLAGRSLFLGGKG